MCSNTNILLLCVLCIFIIKLQMLIYFTPVTNFPVFYGPKLKDYPPTFEILPLKSRKVSSECPYNNLE